MRILVDAETLALVELLQPRISAVNASVQTPAHVLGGAVTVGLNRLLSAHTHPMTDDLAAALSTEIVTAADSFDLDIDAEAERIDLVATRAGLESVDIVCAAARTGVALLSGQGITLGPLRVE